MKKIILSLSCLFCLIGIIFTINAINNKRKYNFINDAVQQFAGNWLKKEIEKNPDQNIVISPVSMYTAIAILTEGADKQAYDELSEILGTQNIPLSEFNQAFQKSSALYSPYAKMANSIWGTFFKPTFKKAVKQKFDADVENIPTTTKPINNWVKKKTNGEITDILPDKELRTTDHFLVNAVYFEADWLEPFEVTTPNIKFYTPSGVVLVDMMEQTQEIPYYRDNIMTAVILKYKNKKDEMTIYLPHKNISWDDFISHLTQSEFIFDFNLQKVELGLPKFDIDYKTEGEKLINTFKEWNINCIFKEGCLRKMGQNAYVQNIIHKAKIKVNDKGTIASAASVIQIFGDTLYGDDTPSIPVVWVNVPFVFKINDALFIGAIMNPNQ